MSGRFANFAHVNNGNRPPAANYTVTALKRWSSSNRHLPNLNVIKRIHIYDFDNTLFNTPLPNELIWSPESIPKLFKPDPFINGGWWHNVKILAATGGGVEVEEPRAWQGWWNEDVVSSARQSIAQKDVLTLLLTGRAEKGYSDLLLRMARSRGLEFDMVCLKPEVTPTNQRVRSTMDFKTQLIQALMLTYNRAEKIKIWEDRLPHVKQFRKMIEEFNRAVQGRMYPVSRPRMWYDIVEVTGPETKLDQVKEVSLIQGLVTQHNAAVTNNTAPAGAQLWDIQQRVAYTAYHVTSPKGQKMLGRFAQVPKDDRQGQVVYHSTHAVVRPGPLPAQTLEESGA